MTTTELTRLERLPTDEMVSLLEKLESAIEAVKNALVCRLDDLDDEYRRLRTELEERGY